MGKILEDEAQAAWFDYRKDFEPKNTNEAYKAFMAGWQAAKGNAEQTGPLR